MSLARRFDDDTLDETCEDSNYDFPYILTSPKDPTFSAPLNLSARLRKALISACSSLPTPTLVLCQLM